MVGGQCKRTFGVAGEGLHGSESARVRVRCITRNPGRQSWTAWDGTCVCTGGREDLTLRAEAPQALPEGRHLGVSLEVSIREGVCQLGESPLHCVFEVPHRLGGLSSSLGEDGATLKM